MVTLVQDKATPVYIAAENGHVEALSILISAGADFNAANKVSNILPTAVYNDVTKSCSTQQCTCMLHTLHHHLTSV